MTGEFYDRMAPLYHLVYADFEEAIAKQAAALDRIVRERWGDVTSILDVACGIGTQALGLAGTGYRVTGSDLSEAALSRARKEAAARGLDIRFSAGDMRRVHERHSGPFDVVIAVDNPLAHLLSDDDVLAALTSFYRMTRPGGGCLVSMRDYDEVQKGGVQFHPIGVRDHAGVRWSVFQIWQWRERGDIYDASMYFVADDGGRELTTQVMRSAFRALSPLRMMALFQEAGFRNVVRIDDVFFQPVIAGTR